MGIGTDIGGSVRIPASNCGIAGFKPTPMRMTGKGITTSKKGMYEGPGGQYVIKSSAGPMARCVQDLEQMMQLWCDNMWRADPCIPKQPWDASIARDEERKLRYGVLRYDKFFPTSPAVARAVDIAAEGLRRDGHEVVELDVDLMWNATTFATLMSAEGDLHSIVSSVEGEKLHPSYEFLYSTTQVPAPVRYMLVKLLGMLGYTRMHLLLKTGYTLNAREYVDATAKRDELCDEFMAMLQNRGIDALLVPQQAVPAMKHGLCSRINVACSYTFLFNNLHFPAGTVPVTCVQPGEDNYDVTPKFGDTFESFAKVNNEGSAGLPIGVQVATLPYCDELCVKAMRDVEKAVALQRPTPKVSATTAKLSY
eukprot:TRINITY_DN24189_c0_g2_i3.p1 TRINITY_DN24189_c0_g2~~TRINITY_DN24189_c0_g2_i3.p1  ORF type:complete len:366 (+),score=168.49 TRINITY_DN24189_c0_g2_i3:88-1185(+)